MREVEILGLNAGYFLGYDGKKQKYLKNPLRSIVGNGDVEEEKLEAFADRIAEMDPDIAGLVEIDTGSIRTRTEGQLEYIKDRLESRGLSYEHSQGFKYRRVSLLQKMPLICSMANGVLYRDAEVEFHYLDRGWKRMMMEVKRPEISFFIVHLPYYLFDDTREEQLKEISDIVGDEKDYVIFGDFNIDTMEELEVLERVNGAKIYSPGETYPAHRPDHPYDLFILGPDIEMVEHEVLDLGISDHLGIRAVVREKES